MEMLGKEECLERLKKLNNEKSINLQTVGCKLRNDRLFEKNCPAGWGKTIQNLPENYKEIGQSRGESAHVVDAGEYYFASVIEG
jgi:hypothetical protein